MMRPRGFVTHWLSPEQAASRAERHQREVLARMATGELPWVHSWRGVVIPLSALGRLERRLNEHDV